jgi:hypothetical protein
MIVGARDDSISSICVGRLTSEKKEKLKTGYVRKFIIGCCLCVDATEVYMISYK